MKVNARESVRDSPIFPEVSGSRLSPLVLVGAPTRGVLLPLDFRGIKRSLAVVLLQSGTANTKVCTMMKLGASTNASP